MEKITIIETEQFGELVKYVLVDKGNGEFTSTEKSYYDEQKANEAEII